MSDEQQQPTDSNPLSVDMAMDLVGKWETHPGLLMAIFDAARRLRDEVELLRDNNVNLMTKIGDLGKQNKAMQTELEQLRDKKPMSQDSTEQTLKLALRLAQTSAKMLLADKRALQTELEQLRAVVAQNNASLSSIVMRWIQPSKN